MTKGEPLSVTFQWDKETKNTVRYAEEAGGHRPVLGLVYINKQQLPHPHPQRIRVTIEPTD